METGGGTNERETGGGASDEGGKKSKTGIDASLIPDFRDKEESNKMTKEDKAVSPNSLPRCHAVAKQVIYGKHQPTPPPIRLSCSPTITNTTTVIRLFVK